MTPLAHPKTPSQPAPILAQRHYENFPVASVFLSQKLREPIRIIYAFARQADDFADEGNLTSSERLCLLNGFRDELNLIQAYINSETPLFMALRTCIRKHRLPLSLFYDLLDAFSQDVAKTRYANYAEVSDYCQRSANPVGRLLLHLYEQATPDNLRLSDNICTALQLINFLQDIAIDLKKNDADGRIYLCQDEMAKFGISEQQIKAQIADANWQKFMQFNLKRADALLQSGKPLGRVLKGRIGVEMRMIIAGGERIIQKIERVKGDVFRHRPQLNAWDWLIICAKAML